MRELRIKEDEFNQNAALVPESDPNVNAINDRILQLKDEIEKTHKDR